MLLTGLIVHGFNPKDLLIGTLLPLQKDTRGNLCDSDNYRAISLCSCLNKIVYWCIMIRYADDLKLLTTSVNALNILVDICTNYAAKYEAMFNAKESLLIIYKSIWSEPPDPNIYIKNVKVPHVNEVIHLGNNLSEDIFKFNASKCVADFNCQFNMYFANFTYVDSNIRNVLFHKYCSAIYGSQVPSMFNSCIEEIYIAWRVAIHRVWCVPWTTHCKLLPHLDNCMDM